LRHLEPKWKGRPISIRLCPRVNQATQPPSESLLPWLFPRPGESIPESLQRNRSNGAFLGSQEYVRATLEGLLLTYSTTALTSSYWASKNSYHSTHSKFCKQTPRKSELLGLFVSFADKRFPRKMWERVILDTLARRPNKKSEYIVLRSEQLVGTALIILVRTDITGAIRKVEAATRKVCAIFHLPITHPPHSFVRRAFGECQAIREPLA